MPLYAENLWKSDAFCFVVNKGVTAYTQIRKCVMKFCQIDKISSRTCVFGDIEFCKLDMISMVIANRHSYMKYLLG